MGLKKILNKKLNLKTFVIIQSLSLFFQWCIVGGLNIVLLLPSFITNSFIVEEILMPLGGLLFTVLFLQVNLISVFDRYSGFLSYIIAYSFILFSYGLLGYLMGKLREKNLTVGYALLCIIIIAAFYSLLGYLLIEIGILQWP